ncbi:MAG TPA: alanine racemase [Bryobacteraceae bacterium]|nr:alanine racemase [Bryobacteraceae bacterium]
MHVSELDTPALVIDLDIFERNLCRVAEYTKANDLRLRPHTKTHKTPAVGKRQLESGAVGLTVAKVGEAEVMLASGTPDLLVAYPVIGRGKLERLTEVAKKTRVTVALDNSFTARQLSEAARQAQVSFGVLAEVDAGMGRVGVSPGEELLQLAQAVGRLPRLTFEGVTFYPGHIKMLGDDGPEEALRQLARTVKGILDDFRRAGIEVRVVSGGSTPTLFRSHEIPGLNEIRPGTYVYNDVNTVRTGACSWDDCAASIVTTVVSTARKGQMIVDGGSKTFSSDRLVGSAEASFGRVVEAPECVFHNMNEEHGYVDIRKAGREFSVGDRVSIIPNHVCVAVNLHERVYGVRNGNVEVTWKVEGRGKLQ